jgi:hypothetical protein
MPAPGNRSLWLKTKCMHREEFVVIGWTDPEGSRLWLGSLLLAYSIQMVGWFMQAASASASTMQSLSNCGIDCCRLPHPKCHSKSRRRPQPLWVAPHPQPCTLGTPRTCRRRQVPHLDRR